MNLISKLFALIVLVSVWIGCDSNSNEPEPESDGELLLDFTAFVEDAVQISGMGVSADGQLAALVTDFERLFVVETATLDVIYTLSIQFGNLPQQGSSEAISFRPDGTLAVLFPDHAEIRTYSTTSNDPLLSAITLPEGAYVGAMAITESDIAIVGVRTASTVTLRSIDLETGAVLEEVPLASTLDGTIEGFGLNGELLWTVTNQNMVYSINTENGAVSEGRLVPDVEDSSAIEPMLDGEGERVLAITDDADEYNAEPSPIRLFLY